ncbi:Ribosomal RNA small subunit methyltransferase E [Aquicella siphonis]|uniref:Ribosomal RNA small subunit methyltransferase E n=1 Tax=Aquicella siphonis TaxID=254247 RepID=A0A5E4PEM2_9COXI|nr:16S rRNA (uracil(1498)-N(3))-methyltransferase [Aquicella siphonis]VVC74863.1 Ribosomal RNA small subunit methyltransferase E [Aquicella siphonis]
MTESKERSGREHVTLSRIYQPAALEIGASLYLDERASHHLARVLRAKTGEKIVLFNGSGGEFTAVITGISKKNVSVEVIGYTEKDIESPLRLHLAQGIARGEKMDFIVQKAVELGAVQIIPLVTERCNVRLGNDREARRWQHWQSVAVSACEQSGRNRLPLVAQPVIFKSWLANLKTDFGYVLSPHVRGGLPARSVPPETVITLLIGPEGGLSDQEVDMAVQHGLKPLSLGPRILRTETAAISALTALQLVYGDMS